MGCCTDPISRNRGHAMSPRLRMVSWVAVAFVLTVPCAPARADAESAVLQTVKMPKELDWIMIPVTVGGTVYHFMFDTGCSHTVFDNALRPHLGDPLGVVHTKTPDG